MILYLIGYDNYIILDLLAQYGADLNQTDKKGVNLVGIAVFNGSVNVIKVLNSYHVRLDMCNEMGRSSICYALELEKLYMVIALLTELKGIYGFGDYINSKLIVKRQELLKEFFASVEAVPDDEEKVKIINAVLESNKSKQNALAKFFQTPRNSAAFFFSKSDHTGSIIKIKEYRAKLLAKINTKDDNSNLTAVEKIRVIH